MYLDPAEFNAHLAIMGQSVKWRRAYACPCVNPNSGQAKPNCPHCGSKGRIWDAALDGTVGVASGNAQKQWVQFGMNDAGDTVVSIPSDSPVYAIGPFDRVSFLNKEEPFSVNIAKGVNERIRFAVASLSRVIWVNGSSLVEGTLPVINDDGTLDWTGVAAPDGVTFSVTGTRRPEYYCYGDMPWDRPIHHGAKLPRRVVLRRFDLYGAQ